MTPPTKEFYHYNLVRGTSAEYRRHTSNKGDFPSRSNLCHLADEGVFPHNHFLTRAPHASNATWVSSTDLNIKLARRNSLCIRNTQDFILGVLYIDLMSRTRSGHQELKIWNDVHKHYNHTRIHLVCMAWASVSDIFNCSVFFFFIFTVFSTPGLASARRVCGCTRSFTVCTHYFLKCIKLIRLDMFVCSIVTVALPESNSKRGYELLFVCLPLLFTFSRSYFRGFPSYFPSC